LRAFSILNGSGVHQIRRPIMTKLQRFAAAALSIVLVVAIVLASSKRSYYSTLTWNSAAPGFQRAIRIAEEVAQAPDSLRPFSETTRHFFSRRSMVGGRTPSWARGLKPVSLDRPVEPDRFRFYDRVS